MQSVPSPRNFEPNRSPVQPEKQVVYQTIQQKTPPKEESQEDTKKQSFLDKYVNKAAKDGKKQSPTDMGKDSKYFKNKKKSIFTDAKNRSPTSTIMPPTNPLDKLIGNLKKRSP